VLQSPESFAGELASLQGVEIVRDLRKAQEVSLSKYRSQIDRDHGWDVLGSEGFEPVRMVAIDEDWSALRFRRKSFIKVMIRPKSYQLTARAKKRGTRTR
jgi:hypothetical protein